MSYTEVEIRAFQSNMMLKLPKMQMMKSCRFEHLKVSSGKHGSRYYDDNQTPYRTSFDKATKRAKLNIDWQCADLWYKSYQFWGSGRGDDVNGNILMRPAPPPSATFAGGAICDRPGRSRRLVTRVKSCRPWSGPPYAAPRTALVGVDGRLLRVVLVVSYPALRNGRPQ